MNAVLFHSFQNTFVDQIPGTHVNDLNLSPVPVNAVNNAVTTDAAAPQCMSTIDIPAVSDVDHDHKKPVVVNPVDDAIGPDPQAAQPLQPALEGFAGEGILLQVVEGVRKTPEKTGLAARRVAQDVGRAL